MKKLFLILSAVALSSLVFAQPPLPAPVKPPTVEAAPSKLPDKALQAALLAMLDAIAVDDFANFTRHASDEFKDKLKREEFTRAVEIAAARLEKGYDVVYFGAMSKPPYSIHLWKIVFRDKGPDVLGEFSVKDEHQEKLDNFFLH